MQERTLQLIHCLSKSIVSGLKDERLYTPAQLRVIGLLKQLNEEFRAVGIFPANPIDIIDRQDALAVKVWTEEDIVNQVIEMRLEPTNAVIDHVKRFGGLKGLGDCTDQDWNAISDAIRSAVAVNGPCNTEIHYTYRDADNYKKSQCAIVKGLITAEQEEKIKSLMDNDGNFLNFIPEQVGLPEARFEKLTTADHCWFEFDYFAHSEKLNNTSDMTVDELVKKFEAVGGKWDDTKFAMENPEIFYEDESEDK